MSLPDNGHVNRDAQLSEEAEQRVRESTVGWLTTLRANGTPHTTCVWFVFIAGEVWVATAVRNAKVRNLRSDARVSFAIDGSADAPLVAQGDAELVPLGESPSAVADAFRHDYDGWDIHDESVDGARVLIRVRIERWLLRG
jgi:PPOX class probable F420-dependent enzyme